MRTYRYLSATPRREPGTSPAQDAQAARRRRRLWEQLSERPGRSVRELAALTGSPRDTVWRDLAALEAGGYIARTPGRTRTIRVLIPCLPQS